MRRKPGGLVPLELAICLTAADLQRDGTHEFHGYEIAKRLGDALTLIATLDGSPVGFAALKGRDQIDMLYVHPAVARQGVATMLVDALEKLAAARGAERLVTDVSDIIDVVNEGRRQRVAARRPQSQVRYSSASRTRS